MILKDAVNVAEELEQHNLALMTRSDLKEGECLSVVDEVG